ncbi:hypothetical protein FNV43_RR06898 [Rhamnella rubrinervis]|uniref:Uncharacterized protein n=1 Tax=Rhamnella rubrinervis TaxID=2594499 RepID=A0A8K0HFG4_9ROSA|nr:hypothetical protein FNV43_RR06898 [Rhamnella rubrinervis]
MGYTCQCFEGSENLMNLKGLPCFKQCSLGADCNGLLLVPTSPPPPPPPQTSSSTSHSQRIGMVDWFVELLKKSPCSTDHDDIVGCSLLTWTYLMPSIRIAAAENAF